MDRLIEIIIGLILAIPPVFGIIVIIFNPANPAEKNWYQKNPKKLKI
jgi:hypothetical protein